MNKEEKEGTNPEEVKEFCSLLKTILAMYPSLRIGQAIGNVIGEGRLYYISNRSFLYNLENYISGCKEEEDD